MRQLQHEEFESAATETVYGGSAATPAVDIAFAEMLVSAGVFHPVGTGIQTGCIREGVLTRWSTKPAGVRGRK